MSTKILWNDSWKFSKQEKQVGKEQPVLSKGEWESVTLPHTWNGTDGQDGGNDYYRGTCLYAKELKKADLPDGDKVYLD